MNKRLLLLAPVMALAAGCANGPDIVTMTASPSCSAPQTGWVTVESAGNHFQPPVHGSAQVCKSGMTITRPGTGVSRYPGPVLIITSSGKQEIIPLTGFVKYAVTDNKPLS